MKKDNDKKRSDIFTNDVLVFSGGKGQIIFHYMLEHYPETIKPLKDTDAKLKEMNRIISNLGADKRELINYHLLAELKRHVHDNSLKCIDPIESDKEEGKLTYKVSGSKLVQKSVEPDLYSFSPRSELNALLVVRRQDEKGKLVDKSIDILEYQEGNLVTLISGGIGETKISDLGEVAKHIGIIIAAGPQLTKPEIKAREKAAAFLINEAFQDSKKKKVEEDLLERVKSGAEKEIDKGEEAVKIGKIIDLSEVPERIQNLHPKSTKVNKKH
ncbi:MAG: hypothetical protein K0T99_00585 [Alphaproteobacteria bacterium]|nr:hypothetical protein [Alphaproteobacteria bacterium]